MFLSLSMRRAWIEITASGIRVGLFYKSLSMRRAWIEIQEVAITIKSHASLSMRRAWIEMRDFESGLEIVQASLSMRRAWIEMYTGGNVTEKPEVALHAESVDRNIILMIMLRYRLQRRSPCGERG